MATELRYIILSDAEFTSSLQSFRRTHEDFLPNGEIVSWAAGENETIDITISIKGGSTVSQMVFTIEKQQVLDILVRFCMENNIPVPRAGFKKWSARESGISLSITLQGAELERANIDMAALA